MELLKSTDGYPTSLPNDQVLELTDVPTLESDLLMFGLVEPTEIVENIPKFKAQLVIMSIHPGQHFVWCSHGRLSDSGIGWP
jgi:hypothetical protein